MNRLKGISITFAPNTRKVIILFIILIIGVPYGLFFYLQNNTEMNIENRLFEQQRERQIESTEALSPYWFRLGFDNVKAGAAS